jgi:hypothetical protein
MTLPVEVIGDCSQLELACHVFWAAASNASLDAFFSSFTFNVLHCMVGLLLLHRSL